MDIFSVTSKQVEVASTPKTESANPIRQVEQSNETTKMNKEDQKEKLTQTVKDLNDQMDLLDTNIKFGFNDKIDVLFVNVMEKSSGKSVRKIPTEEAMALSEKMKEVVGMIFDKKG